MVPLYRKWLISYHRNMHRRQKSNKIVDTSSLNRKITKKKIKKLKKQTVVPYADAPIEVNTPAVEELTFPRIDPFAVSPFNVFNSTPNTIEFELNSDDDDDNTLISNADADICSVSKEPEKSNEPIIFSNNYFKVMETNDNALRAMCVNCGFDENNKPKKVLSARRNVSSNLILHLKVKYFIKILLFVVIFNCFFVVAKTSNRISTISHRKD